LFQLLVRDKFLPEPLSEEELRQHVEAAISKAGASGPSDMGKVMKILIPSLQGRVPGSQASKMVKDLLA